MGRYKIVNIILAVIVTITALVVNLYVKQGYCVDLCTIETMRGLVNPAAVATPIISAIFVLLLIFPADLFRRWLWYCGGPLFLLFVFEVSTISTRGGGVMTPTRVGVAELLAQVYLVVTVAFVAGYYVWRWYQSRTK